MKIIGVAFFRKGTMVITTMWENAFLKTTDGIFRFFVPMLNSAGNREIKGIILISKASFLLIRPVKPGAEGGG